MCQQCSAATVTYGEFLPDWRLVRATKDYLDKIKSGDWGLVVSDDPDFWFPSELVPKKDPSFGMTEDQFDNMTDQQGKAWDEFCDVAHSIEKHLTGSVHSGYYLMKMAYKIGYDRKKDGLFHLWLTHKLAELIEKNPTGDEKIAEKITQENMDSWGLSRDENYNLIEKAREQV